MGLLFKKKIQLQYKRQLCRNSTILSLFNPLEAVLKNKSMRSAVHLNRTVRDGRHLKKHNGFSARANECPSLWPFT